MWSFNSIPFDIIAAALCILTGAGWIAIAFGLIIQWPEFGKLSKAGRWKAWGLIVCGLICASPFWFIELVAGNQVVISGPKATAVFTKSSIVTQSKWNQLMAGPNAHLASFEPWHANVAMGIHPITENPKVRSLRYFVRVETGRTVEDVLLLEKSTGFQVSDIRNVSNGQNSDASGNFTPLGTKTKSLLYEFNDKHSKELALYYNPLDASQQIGFSNLVTGYLQEPLSQMGAHVTHVEFKLED